MSGTRLKNLIKTWSDFDLKSLQSELDVMATEIADRQDRSEESRKCLIAVLNDFISSNDESVKNRASDVITSFQKEVDLLTGIIRESDKTFLKLYSKLTTDISDPVPTMESLQDSVKQLSKVQDLEIETAQLRDTIKDYNIEIQKYKNKMKKMAELQSKVDAYDRNIDATLEERIGDVTRKIVEESDAKIAEINHEKEVLLAKVNDQDAKIKTMQRNLDNLQTELFDSKRAVDDSSEAKRSELDIIMNDLERANSRVILVEKEKETLKEQLEELKKQKIREERDVGQEELESKTREVTRLLTECDRLQRENRALEVYYEDKIRILETETATLNSRIVEINDELSRFADYDSVKHELNILKCLEFSESDETKSVEVLIRQKSKLLQSENSSLRLENEKLSNENRTLRTDLEDKVVKTEQQSKLITELESHVESLQGDRGEAEGRSSTDILNEALHHVKVDDEVGRKQEASMLPIVQAQRERFRARNEELEELRTRHLQQIQLLQEEVEDLKSDNVKMFEKIKFLQSASGRASSSSSSSNDVEARYRTKYEQELNPFTSFNRRERSRQYNNLNLCERIILSLVHFMMSNKTARVFVFAYSIILHLLVFAVLIMTAYNDSYKRDIASEWYDKYAKHMHDVHQQGP